MKAVEYLGDGLYASFDGYELVLMSGSHSAPENIVYLDPSVRENLKKFLDRFIEDMKGNEDEHE